MASVFPGWPQDVPEGAHVFEFDGEGCASMSASDVNGKPWIPFYDRDGNTSAWIYWISLDHAPLLEDPGLSSHAFRQMPLDVALYVGLDPSYVDPNTNCGYAVFELGLLDDEGKIAYRATSRTMTGVTMYSGGKGLPGYTMTLSLGPLLPYLDFADPKRGYVMVGVVADEGGAKW